MTERTPAQEQAEFLTALAEHLTSHPQLSWVHVQGRNDMVWQAQVTVAGNPDGTNSRALVRWATSIGTATVSVKPMTDPRRGAIATTRGAISGFALEVCAVIEGLVLPYDWTRQANEAAEITVADLEYFAEHATLPEAGER